MGKLEDAPSAPQSSDPMSSLWALAAAVTQPPKKLPPGFEDEAIARMARAAIAMGEPKSSWGIGFSRVAEAGAKLLAVCPTERLARCVLGLAALSGIGGGIVTAIRKRKATKAITAALAEFDRREAKASTYPAMRKAMKGFVDEVFPPTLPKKVRPPRRSVPRLHIVNGRIIGPLTKKKDERRILEPKDLKKKERDQLVGVLAKAFGLKQKSFTFDDIFSGESDHEELRTTAHTPIEWWDVVDDTKKVRYQLFTYHVDCGSLVEAGTTKRLASIIQFGFGVEVKDPGHALARSMEAAHAELRRRCRRSELAGMSFTLDD